MSEVNVSRRSLLRLLRSVRWWARVRRAGRELPETAWRERNPGQDWLEGYWDSWRLPRRENLVDHIAATFGAPNSVLDVGCHCGPNLRRLYAEFPQCRLLGFDINEPAIDFGRQRFAQLGASADLRLGSFHDLLPQYPADHVDLVVSSYSLAYVPPADVDFVLTELVRISRWGLVLAEPQPIGQRKAGLLTQAPAWRHDYASRLSSLVHSRITVLDLPVAGHEESGLLLADWRAG